MKNNKSQHILNASSNLIGICFIVLTSFKVLKLGQASIIDEITAVASVLLMVSCIFSFLSIRTSNEQYSVKYENVAESCFIIGLSIMFITVMVIAFDFIK
jgi:hypothetical protein